MGSGRNYISSSELPLYERTDKIHTNRVGWTTRRLSKKYPTTLYLFFQSQVTNFPSQLGHAPWLFFAPEFPENDDNIWYKKNGNFLKKRENG